MSQIATKNVQNENIDLSYVVMLRILIFEVVPNPKLTCF